MVDDETPQDPFSGSALLGSLSFSDTSGLTTPLALLAREDLDPVSVDDLQTRIKALEAEIARARGAIETKHKRRSAADALFSFKGN
jgi:uncharacterized small protein (DUF1192 family)